MLPNTVLLSGPGRKKNKKNKANRSSLFQHCFVMLSLKIQGRALCCCSDYSALFHLRLTVKDIVSYFCRPLKHGRNLTLGDS